MFTLLALPSVANAMDIKPYTGIGIGGYSINVSNSDGATTALGTYGQLGADVGDYFGAEVRLGTSGKTSFRDKTGVNMNINIDYIFSYLGKVQAPIGKSVHAYALLGGTTGQFTRKIKTPGFIYTSTGTTTFTNKVSSFTAGVGLDFQIQDKLLIGAEYMHYFKSINGFSANLKFLF